jgi:hypothetical protein
MHLGKPLGKKKTILYSVLFPTIIFIIASLISKNEILNLALTLLLIPIFLLLNLNEKIIILLALLALIMVTVFNIDKYQVYIVIESYWQLLVGSIILFIRTIPFRKNKILNDHDKG